MLGEFTGRARFSAAASQPLFSTSERHAWHVGIRSYLADVLCTYHRRWDPAFHLSTDHQRVDMDFPCDLAEARELYQGIEERPLQVAN